MTVFQVLEVFPGLLVIGMVLLVGGMFAAAKIYEHFNG